MDRPTAGHDNSTIGRPALCTPRRRLFTGRSVFIYIIIVQLPLLASGPKVPVDVLKKNVPLDGRLFRDTANTESPPMAKLGPFRNLYLPGAGGGRIRIPEVHPRHRLCCGRRSSRCVSL
jgi:hypothetical protein